MYIREAHPTDGWRRPATHLEIEDPKTHEERTKVAQGCASELKLTMPVLVDDMQDTVSRAYAADPDRLFIIGVDAKIAFAGDRGPRGFDVGKMEKALKAILEPSTGDESGK